MLAIALAGLAVLILNWIGYPLLMAAVGRVRRRALPRGPAGPALPRVAVIIATRDPPETVLRRVEDIRQSRYPAERLQVIVAVDARSPYPRDDIARQLGERAFVVAGDSPGGKAPALNAGVRRAVADLLVFTDSSQRFAPDAIPELVRFLADRRYGAVSGAVVHEGDRLLAWYWEYEMAIRRGQSALHSITGGTGAIHAMRRDLWQPLPADLISDDLYATMRLVMAGQRVGFTTAARAFDPRRFTGRQLFRRRVRTLTGIVQLVAWMPAVLLPWKNPIWPHFVCHKLMRFATPYLAILAGVGIAGGGLLRAPAGAGGWVVAGATALLLAAVFAIRPRAGRCAARQAGTLLLTLVAPIVAAVNGLRGRWQVWHHDPPRHDGRTAAAVWRATRAPKATNPTSANSR